jgi:hypothetical protein
MCRLLLGCVADGWLIRCPDLKQTGLNHVAWSAIAAEAVKKRTLPGYYTRALQTFLLNGDWTQGAKDALRSELWQEAIARLDECKDLLHNVNDAHKGTGKGLFLGLYLNGYNAYSTLRPDAANSITDLEEQKAKNLLPGSAGDVLWDSGLTGILPDLEKPPDFSLYEPTQPTVPSKTLKDQLAILVVDFVDYIEVAYHWRDFVFATRCILNIVNHFDNAVWMMVGNKGHIA